MMQTKPSDPEPITVAVMVPPGHVLQVHCPWWPADRWETKAPDPNRKLLYEFFIGCQYRICEEPQPNPKPNPNPNPPEC